MDGLLSRVRKMHFAEDNRSLALCLAKEFQKKSNDPTLAETIELVENTSDTTELRLRINTEEAEKRARIDRFREGGGSYQFDMLGGIVPSTRFVLGPPPNQSLEDTKCEEPENGWAGILILGGPTSVIALTFDRLSEKEAHGWKWPFSRGESKRFTGHWFKRDNKGRECPRQKRAASKS